MSDDGCSCHFGIELHVYCFGSSNSCMDFESVGTSKNGKYFNGKFLSFALILIARVV